MKLNNVELDELKILIVPSMVILIRHCLGRLKEIILNDKYARLFILQNCMIKIKNNLYSVIDKHTLNYDKKIVASSLKKIDETLDNLIDAVKDFIKYDGVLNYKYNHLFSKCSQNTQITGAQIETCIYNYIPFLNANYVTQCIDNSRFNINDLILELPSKNDSNIKSYIQGKNSMLKNVHRRIIGFRSQIALRPELPQDAILLPFGWSEQFSIKRPKIIDVTSCKSLNKGDLYEFGGVVLSKRDPAINGASLSVHTKVGFVKSDYIFINIGGIPRKNADFDGDSVFCCVIFEKSIVAELISNMHPEFNFMLYNEPRLTITEAHILYMHQRRPKQMKHYDLYNAIREYEIYRWKSDRHNMDIIKNINKYSSVDIEKYVEPTKTILNKMIKHICFRYGSSEAYKFFNYINENVLILSNNDAKSLKNDLYDENLPLVYLAQADILSENIVRCCLSGAAGSITVLNDMVTTFISTDNTTEITDNVAKGDMNEIFDKFYTASKNMAVKSREVPKNGSKFNQLNIAWDLIEFKHGDLYFSHKLVYKDINSVFDSKLFLSPDDLFYLTFLK